MPTEEDWRSYARAVVDIAPADRGRFRIIPARPGVTDRWPDGLEPPIVIVTAWNPDSGILPPGDNQARNQLLVAELDHLGLTHWPAVGRDPGTPYFEEGMAVSGLTEAQGVALGGRHGQAAVYVWTPEAWSIVPWADGTRHTAGWRLVDHPPVGT